MRFKRFNRIQKVHLQLWRTSTSTQIINFRRTELRVCNTSSNNNYKINLEIFAAMENKQEKCMEKEIMNRMEISILLLNGRH